MNKLRASNPDGSLRDPTRAGSVWRADQARRARGALDRLPDREYLRAALSRLSDAAGFGMPLHAGSRSFRFEPAADGRWALCVREDGSHRPRVVVDPRGLREGEAVFSWFPSPEGRYLAYRVARGGSSLMDLRVVDVATGHLLEDAIPRELNPAAHLWHTSNPVVWDRASTGFFFTRRPAEVPEGEERYHQKLYFHRLGTPFAQDELVFGEALLPEQCPYPRLSDDGRWLAVVVRNFATTEARSDLAVRDLEASPTRWMSLVEDEPGLGEACIHRGWIYLETRRDAPRGRIQRTALGKEGLVPAEWMVVVPEGPHPLRHWRPIGEHLVVEDIRQVSSRLSVFDLDGGNGREVPLPDSAGTVGAIAPAGRTDRAYCTFSTPFARPQLLALDLSGGHPRLDDSIPSVPSPDFECRQEWCTSADGTRVPFYLLRRKGLRPTGENPAVLYGYGGFGVSLLPAYRPKIVPFLERGGVYVLVNVRGGGEFGEDWHKAGMREGKSRAVDDFIAAAEWLCSTGWSRPEKLGAHGRSNGGWLVNAAAVRRPDLFRAVVAVAPVTDLTRFHLADAARHWIAEYGSPEDPEDLDFLLKLSPYHSIPRVIEAPAILIVVPEADDRVAPRHGCKMAAAWQEATRSDRPVLLHLLPGAGHSGTGASSAERDMWVDIWSFFFYQLGV